jgi:hypothetical protein
VIHLLDKRNVPVDGLIVSNVLSVLTHSLLMKRPNGCSMVFPFGVLMVMCNFDSDISSSNDWFV